MQHERHNSLASPPNCFVCQCVLICMPWHIKFKFWNISFECLMLLRDLTDVLEAKVKMQTLEYCFTLFYPFANVMPSIERNCLMKLWSLLNRKAERENLKWWALVRQVSLGFLFELQREPWLFREKIQKLKHQCAEMPERRRRGCLTLPLHRKGSL